VATSPDVQERADPAAIPRELLRVFASMVYFARQVHRDLPGHLGPHHLDVA
jgi:hypothetical protein